MKVGYKRVTKYFNFIYELLSVYHTVYYTLKDQGLAEDLNNDAYLLVFEKIHTLKDKENFRTWICSITANLAKDYIKKNKRLHTVDTIEEFASKADTVEDVACLVAKGGFHLPSINETAYPRLKSYFSEKELFSNNRRNSLCQ